MVVWRAVLAARDVPAESRRAAALDGAHHLHLAEAHMAAVGFTPSADPWSRKMSATSRAGRATTRRAMPAASPSLASGGSSRSSGLVTARSTWWRRGCSAPSCRAWRARAAPGSRARRCRSPADAWRSCAAACAATPSVPSPAASRRHVADAVELACRDRQQRIAAREQPALRAALQPPRAQQLEQLRREHRVPVLAALALLDPDQHALGVDVADRSITTSPARRPAP